jgi:transcriptional regulator with XRE-family HTH domain
MPPKKKKSPSAASGNDLVDALNKIYRRCGENEAEMARQLGVRQANVHRWRSGAVRPSAAAIKHIAATFGLSEADLLGGRVDSAVVAEPSLVGQEKRTLEHFEVLIRSDDEEVRTHLIRQVDIFYKRRKREK